MSAPKVKPEELRWEEAEAAARGILAACESSKYAPPEGQQQWLNVVGKCMNRIAEALCFTKLEGE